MREEIEVMRTFCQKQQAIPYQSDTTFARYAGYIQALEWILELSDKLEGRVPCHKPRS